MASTASQALVEATFASSAQLGADSPPPELVDDVDLSLRIHQTAVGNYLTMAIGGAIIKQDSADEPPRLTGDVPPWVAKLAGRNAPLSDSEVRQDEDGPEISFKPWSLTLNSAAPASVGFDDGRLSVRIRAALLTSDENEFANWDLLVHYQVAQRKNRIVLRRDGEIEVFPTLFDPQWDQRLSAQQSGQRNALATPINARADAGHGFPAEIAIDPVHPPMLGELELIQLQADDGWLTLGWRLP
jgi:hypothetical protein